MRTCNYCDKILLVLHLSIAILVMIASSITINCYSATDIQSNPNPNSLFIVEVHLDLKLVHWHSIFWNKLNRLRIPTGRRQASWLCTSAATVSHYIMFPMMYSQMSKGIGCYPLSLYSSWWSFCNHHEGQIITHHSPSKCKAGDRCCLSDTSLWTTGWWTYSCLP